jgi:hypothetical protein
MIVHAFKYVPFIPPYTPAKEAEDDWFNGPLDVFSVPGYSDTFFASKPCHAVYIPYSERLVGYYCAITDTHVLCMRRFMECLSIRD